MQTTWKVTEADRDAAGSIKVASDAPRSLADLLPKPAEIKADAARRQPWTNTEAATLAAVAFMAAFVLVYAWATPNAPTAAPTPRQTTAPTIAPAAATAPPVRMFPAFDRPAGALLGEIEATRAITPTAHYSSDWIQADVAGSGLIWLRASDFPALAIVGPDLSPRPVIAAAPAPAPYVPAAEQAPAPPAPPQCAEAGIPGQMVSVCGEGDLATLEERAKAEWLATYGGNIGVVGHPTPQIKDTP